jgi:hypothetical protein
MLNHDEIGLARPCYGGMKTGVLALREEDGAVHFSLKYQIQTSSYDSISRADRFAVVEVKILTSVPYTDRG